ncbi:uncharacterized protein [Clytia hemisphaerica]|uniref:uncharacterized protein n=1 Tax=Clytia hemisphaerica TaxID=252671 RepID=UPI0034D4ACF4
MAKKLNLCYNCLKKDHFTSKCKSKNNCFNAGCDERHHTTLHEYFTEHVKESFLGNTQVVEQSGTVYLSVVPVKLQGLDSSSITTYALLDTGSQSTLVRNDVAKKLKLKKKDKKITITTINDIGTKTKVKETSMRVENRDDGIGVNIDHCYIVPKSSFHMPKQQYPSTMMKKMKEEKGIKLHNALYEEIGILIGANVPSVHIPLEVKEGENSEPLAIKTIFGWTLFGASGQPETVSMNRIVIEPEADLHHCVQRIWDQDFITNPSDRDEALSIEDKRCHEKLESETVLADGKYQVPMLWKKDVTLSNNRTVAEKRFHQLQNKLRREPNLRKLYDQSMTKYLEIGYARKMTLEEAATAHPRTWYLPHYGVFNPNKPGKIRLVFDAAAKFQGTSLNDALYTGPDLLNNMLGVLMRFRTHHFAFSADIEGMFNQVKVNQEDTQSLRFLWKEDIDSPDQPDTYQMLVHIMGATCSPTCANYALKRCARDHLGDFDPSTIETILRSFYVDDLLKSSSTKRGILSVVSSLYDPLGFLSPFTTTAKMILQDVWKDGTNWDEPVNYEIQRKWNKWQSGLSTIDMFKLERCYNIPISSKIQLHIFDDASENAYGAVAYLRTTTEPISVSFVLAKGRVAPTKQVPLPRLELSAATIAVRLYRLIIKEIDLPIEDSHFWSDSTLTLQYITNERNRFKTFVANRVSEIREVTQPTQWHHVNGEENPGDITTRGVFSVEELLHGESMETDDFLNALQRFISRRQKPRKLLSDCGSNFKGAVNELKEELRKLNQHKIGEFCSLREIEWQFNPPSAPHMGGAWERLVRTVKTSMKFTLKNLILTEFQLMTFIAEVENMVNSRPLTPISEDPKDLALFNLGF